MTRLRAAFNYFDTNRSGNINTAELGAVLAHIGKPQRPENLPAIVSLLFWLKLVNFLMVLIFFTYQKKLRDADYNNSGSIEFNEFVNFIVRQHLLNWVAILFEIKTQTFRLKLE